MNYKIEGAIRRNKKTLVVFVIIWLILAIFILPTFTYGYAVATRNGTEGLTLAVQEIGRTMFKPFEAFKCLIKYQAMGSYFSTLLVSTIIYSIFFFIGFVKSAPKNEYTDIEHGSSDWSQHGEQYKIISKNKGIILAENNYLPVDKRGNVNVLVVGRIRIW